MASDLLRGRLILWVTVFAGAAVVGLPRWRGFSPPPVGIAGGALVGTMLFVTLAGAPRLPRVQLRVVLARSVYLAAAAAFEELLWRGLALGALLPRIGPGLALAATSAGFALLHARSLGRRCAVHLVTGCSFGATFLGGGLAASIAAHAVYNALVDLAVQAERAPWRQV